jgi:hypothetical protein
LVCQGDDTNQSQLGVLARRSEAFILVWNKDLMIKVSVNLISGINKDEYKI